MPLSISAKRANQFEAGNSASLETKTSHLQKKAAWFESLRMHEFTRTLSLCSSL